jgi:vacuolar-type H+-ATPase subunit H
MDHSYSMDDLISMLEEVISNATHVPFVKKSMVAVDDLEDIAQRMRLSLPGEIQQAKKVVYDKNRIIADAKAEAESIIRKAELQRAQLLDQNDLMKEARRRATEAISEAQARSNAIHANTTAYADNMLMRVEELMAKDLNELRVLRKSINAAGNIQTAPQAPTPPTAPTNQTSPEVPTQQPKR